MPAPSLREALDAMTAREVIQWLRDRGVIVLRPERLTKSALVNTAMDAQAELDRGYLAVPPARP